MWYALHFITAPGPVFFSIHLCIIKPLIGQNLLTKS